VIDSIHLVESKWRELDLDAEQAREVARLGKDLASKASWWGQGLREPKSTEPSLLQCRPTSSGRWEIRVDNAIGAFGIGDLNFIVAPKLRLSHVIFLLACANVLPRTATNPTGLADGSDFFDVIVRWFLTCVQKLVAQDLIRDYEEQSGELRTARGHVAALPTAERYYSGNLTFFCQYDEFAIDNPLNRLLLEAIRRAQAMGSKRSDIRRQAQGLATYFTGVGRFRVTDLTPPIDRRSHYYADAIRLAQLIVASTTVQLNAGGQQTWTFLIRTPEAIEAGVRNVLQTSLAPDVRVRKYGTRLRPSSLIIEPDLRFDPIGAVGDCKYKICEGEWGRMDLYQSVAFAAGARTSQSCVISFAEKDLRPPESAHFGSIVVTNLLWEAFLDSPEDAAFRLAARCRAWLSNLNMTLT